LVKRLVRPALRLAVKTLPTLRQKIAPLRRNIHIAMSPEEIENSVIESLRLLQTDYIDVLALHEPSIAMCKDPATLDRLESLVKKGYVRCLSIAGSLESIIAGSEASSLFQFAQFQDNPFLEATDQLCHHPATRNHFLITHSVFGSGALRQFGALMQTSRYSDSTENSADLLFDYALAKNPNGIVLSSMFSRKHSDTNCAHAAAPINPNAIGRVQSVLAVK
jgi:aryl-alcohol dehydrogenase-like predicted oxidoreductase